ncbi:MAG: MBOAT family protein [Clostridiales bacterium]|nr:MBOAT family protein [Clostridiales bacterium]
MLAGVCVNYISGLFIDRGEKKSKLALIVGIFIDVIFIGIFKYAGFIAETINSFGFAVPVPNISLPIGISFYTFQSMSYLADVYFGKVPAQTSFKNLLLYISMFPQLIAGPIVRYSTIAEEINDRRATKHDIAAGSFRFFVGLAKKVILANQLSVISFALLDGELSALSTGGAWIGIFAFAMQIYFDFSGYSDMAIGMGRCMGFHFDENFDYPYISKSMTEFWRRWHISLESFFRDYVYIPLGGNRRHHFVNVLIVWFLTGLWHGASWNFVIWGLFFGLIIFIEKCTLLKVIDKIPGFIMHLYAVIVVTFSWCLFYFEDFGRLKEFLPLLVGRSVSIWDIMAKNQLLNNIWLIIAAVICCTPIGRGVGKVYKKLSLKVPPVAAVFKAAAAAALLGLSTLLLIGATNNPFLYFRF